jgi:hypothetical protein
MPATSHPDTPAERDSTYARLLEISTAACAEQHYELAYHALAAAFHRAVALGAVELLEQVSQVATAQQEQVHLPPSTVPLASALAVADGAMSTLYSSLAQMAQARAQSVGQRPERAQADV